MMPNVQKLLTGALSGLQHGRRTTARRKTVQAALALSPELQELLDLTGQDVFTDAVEYQDRVQRIEELREAIIKGNRAPLNTSPNTAKENPC